MKHKVMNNRSVKKSRAIVAALVCNGFWGLSFMASDIALKESRDVIRNFFNGREAYAIFNMITNGEPEMENQRNFPFNEK